MGRAAWRDPAMRRLVLTLLALTLSAGGAFADITYYLSPTGSDGNAGTSSTTPWRSISKANSSVAAPNSTNGNIIIQLAAGSYAGTGTPNPATTAVDGKYFYWVGNVAAPTTVTVGVTGGLAQILTPNQVIRGVQFLGDLRLGANYTSSDSTKAYGTRVWDCTLNGSLDFANVRGASVRRCRILGCQIIFHGGPTGTGANIPPPAYCKRDTLESCTATRLTYCFATAGTSGGASGFQVERSDSCRLMFNRLYFDIPVQQGSYEGSSVRMYNQRWFSFYRNWWFTYNRWGSILDCSMSPPDDPSCIGYRNTWKIRNNSYAWSFRGDSIFFSGPTPCNLVLAMKSETQGDVDSVGSVKDWTLDSVYIYNPKGDGFVTMTQPPNNVTVTNSVIVGKDRAINFGGSGSGGYQGTCTFQHNTLVGEGRRGIVLADPVFPHPSASTWGKTPSLIWKDNLHYATGAEGIQVCNFDPGDWWQPTVSVFLNERTDTTRSTFSNNLHAIYAYAGTVGDKAYAWYENGRNCAGYDLNSQRINLFPAKDVSAVYGHHGLDGGNGDTLVTDVYENDAPRDFNPRIGRYSRARGTGTAGSDIGARPFVSVKAIQVIPDTVDFSYVGPGGIGYAHIIVKNVGTDTLTIDGLGSWNPTGNEVEAGGISSTFWGPELIRPGESTSWSISYERPSDGEDSCVGCTFTEPFYFNAVQVNFAGADAITDAKYVRLGVIRNLQAQPAVRKERID
jgi:hypothetical protein